MPLQCQVCVVCVRACVCVGDEIQLLYRYDTICRYLICGQKLTNSELSVAHQIDSFITSVSTVEQLMRDASI